jgi:hypothetical protein
MIREQDLILFPLFIKIHILALPLDDDLLLVTVGLFVCSCSVFVFVLEEGGLLLPCRFRIFCVVLSYLVLSWLVSSRLILSCLVLSLGWVRVRLADMNFTIYGDAPDTPVSRTSSAPKLCLVDSNARLSSTRLL